MYSVWKGASVLERLCCRGVAKVRARVLLTAIMLQAIGLLSLLQALEQLPVLMTVWRQRHSRLLPRGEMWGRCSCVRGLGLAAVGFGGLRRIRAGGVVRRSFSYFECFMAQNAVLRAVIGRNHDCVKWSTGWRKQTLIRFSGLIS